MARARDHPPLSQLVGQRQYLPVAFGQQCPGAMVAPVFPGELAQPGALLGRDHEGAGGAVLTASDDPGSVELATGATAVGFSTAAFLQIEGPRGHGLVAQEVLENAARGVMGAPELLAEFREFTGHLRVIYHIACRHASKKMQKKRKPRKKGVRVAPPSKKPRLGRF